MKSAATLRSTALGKAITVLALLAIAGFATLVFRNESLKREPQTVEVPLGGLLRKLAIGDAAQKRGAMQGLALRMHTALEFPQVVQALISVLQDDDTAADRTVGFGHGQAQLAPVGQRHALGPDSGRRHDVTQPEHGPGFDPRRIPLPS